MTTAAGQLRPKREQVSSGFDVDRVRADFPILQQKVHGKPLIYLDSAATAQKPQCVIDAIVDYYTRINANVHRGIHLLSQKATDAYEHARLRVRDFLHAQWIEEIVFVRGTTEAINLVAQSFVKPRLKPGDHILISAMEHHSNIVAWQILCEQTGALLKVAPIDDTGELVMEEFQRLLTAQTRFVSVAHVSNALGTINPVRAIVELVHRHGIPIMLDGAQAVPHLPVNVREIGCDFYTFSGHKAFGPTGIGALYAKREWLEDMSPYQSGGDMIKSVTFEKTEYNDLPYKFEAGTPDIAGAIGLGAALDYLESWDRASVVEYEHQLLTYATKAIGSVPGIRLIGTAREKAAVVSFVLDGVHAHDLGTVLDREGIAIRTGHHCAQPVMDRFGLPATARVSLAFYNTREEIDATVVALHRAIEVFR
ncbi:MAG: cysteine desulfurase [Planctomycetota bacterium]